MSASKETVYLRLKLVVEEEILKNMFETFSFTVQEEKKFFRKEVDSLKVKIKYIKIKTWEINKKHKQINEKFTDLEEETMKTVTEENVFTKCDFACIGQITMRKHVNTKHESVLSDIGAKQIKFRKVQ